MKRKINFIITTLLVSITLVVSLFLLEPYIEKYEKWQKKIEMDMNKKILQNVFISTHINLKHFPPGIYFFQEGGKSKTVFSREGTSLKKEYEQMKLPEGGASIKFLIREDGKFDFATRGVIKNRGSIEEKRLIGQKLCTIINENPNINIGDDKELSEINKFIFKAIRNSIKFRDELYVTIDKTPFHPFELLRSNGKYYGENGNLKIFFKKEYGNFYIEGFLNDGTDENGLSKYIKPGIKVRTTLVKRAMINDSIVGTIMPCSVDGFFGKIELYIGINNSDKLTGVVCKNRDKIYGIGARLVKKNSRFLRQFEGLLVNDINIKKDKKGLIDGVTGATFSAKKIVETVRKALIFNDKLNMEEYR